MKARLGAAEAVAASAHKLARLIYRLIKHGEAHVRQGMDDYERKFHERKLKQLKKSAAAMGFELTAKQSVALPVS
jgi:phosphohistidine phosphatase SixA